MDFNYIKNYVIKKGYLRGRTLALLQAMIETTRNIIEKLSPPSENRLYHHIVENANVLFIYCNKDEEGSDDAKACFPQLEIYKKEWEVLPNTHSFIFPGDICQVDCDDLDEKKIVNKDKRRDWEKSQFLRIEHEKIRVKMESTNFDRYCFLSPNLPPSTVDDHNSHVLSKMEKNVKFLFDDFLVKMDKEKQEKRHPSMYFL